MTRARSRGRPRACCRSGAATITSTRTTAIRPTASRSTPARVRPTSKRRKALMGEAMRTVVSMLTLVAAMSAAMPAAFGQPRGGGGPPQPDSIGTGPFPALKEIDAGLPDQVVYRPADLSALGSTKLGIYVFGNGACSDDAASSRQHLLEIASHGYLAIAPGGIYSGPGATQRPAPAGQRNPADDAPTRPEQLRAAIDWALAENARPGSPYYNR